MSGRFVNSNLDWQHLPDIKAFRAETIYGRYAIRLYRVWGIERHKNRHKWEVYTPEDESEPSKSFIIFRDAMQYCRRDFIGRQIDDKRDNNQMKLIRDLPPNPNDTKIKLLPHAHSAPMKGSTEAAGWDLYASMKDVSEITLMPSAVAKIDTGVCIQLPRGKEAQIRSRSGLAFKHGVVVLNGVGTIDADYRGEIGVLLINHGQEAVTIRRGDRIAQMVIADVCMNDLQIVDDLDETQRSDGGFGSTGK